MTRHLIAQSQLELRVLFRQPGFWIPSVLFPVMLFAFFGASAGNWAANAMASFMVYAVVGIGFFQFGVSLAQDRESPFASWQKSLPGSAATQWVARVLVSVVFSTIAVSLVIAMAVILNGTTLNATAWVRLGIVCLMSSVTATIMGIALGSVSSARAAVPLAQLIYLPMAYLGGLWMPPMFLPKGIAEVSVWVPTRAMGELGWAAVNGAPWEPRFVLVLLLWTAAAAVMAGIAQKFDSMRSLISKASAR